MSSNLPSAHTRTAAATTSAEAAAVGGSGHPSRSLSASLRRHGSSSHKHSKKHRSHRRGSGEPTREEEQPPPAAAASAANASAAARADVAAVRVCALGRLLDTSKGADEHELAHKDAGHEDERRLIQSRSADELDSAAIRSPAAVLPSRPLWLCRTHNRLLSPRSFAICRLPPIQFMAAAAGGGVRCDCGSDEFWLRLS